MAFFKKESISVSKYVQIVDSETNEHFTTYIIEVNIGCYNWKVKHRYKEFYELHEKLKLIHKLDKSLLPPKRRFEKQSDDFIKRRQYELQAYLQTVFYFFSNQSVPALNAFLDFDLYEIHCITQALAVDLYNRGESLLQSGEAFHVTPLQLHSLCERLRLPEPTCDSGDVKKDLGHILDFITRAKRLQICGMSEPVGTSNIYMNQLNFDLSLFKSLLFLEVISCNPHMIQGLETIKQTLQEFHVYCSASTVKEIVLRDSATWKGEDGVQLVGGWDHVTHVNFSHNTITDVDDSIAILWRTVHLDLSHNQLTGLQHLHWLSQVSHLDLSYNQLHHLHCLHAKLGNVKCLVLTGNGIESLSGFSKLYSLEVLDVRCNKIMKTDDVRPVCSLPCLEVLRLDWNGVTGTVEYRTRTLVMFGNRLGEVCLDNQRASQQEKDTMAVRLALQKARDVDLSSLSSATFPSRVRLQDVCSTATGSSSILTPVAPVDTGMSICSPTLISADNVVAMEPADVRHPPSLDN